MTFLKRSVAAAQTSLDKDGELNCRLPITLDERLNTVDQCDVDGATPHCRLVAVVEIERFGALRHRIGYAMATHIIGRTADLVRESVPGSQVGRLGRVSVEFAFTARSFYLAREQLAKLVTTLEQPLVIDDYSFELSVAIGAAGTNGQMIDDRHLDAAAAALAVAQDGGEKFVIVDGHVLSQVGVSELSIMRDLRQAIRDEALTLHYQPKLRCRTNTIDSAEALLRWHHPEFGLVATDKLIEMAEATGAIRELTLWVINRALADQSRLAAKGRVLSIYVNISGHLLADRSFAEWALTRLADAGGAIGFEITETAVIKDPTIAIEHLRRFAAAGVRIAIDDYGTGLSSLAYLKQLPAHELKIDRMFVGGLTESHRDPLLVRSSIDLAHALEMEVTAEGVENSLSLSLLRVMGCDLVQGYLVSRPLPIDVFETFLFEERHRQNIAATAPLLHGWNVAPAALGN